jgi:hypothetical protein
LGWRPALGESQGDGQRQGKGLVGGQRQGKSLVESQGDGQGERPGEKSDAGPAFAAYATGGILWRFLAGGPGRHWPRLFGALSEYWECRAYLAYLRRRADRVQNQGNRVLVEKILGAAGRDLIREAPSDWPELTGLGAQKLAHLSYHEEIMSGRGLGAGRSRARRAAALNNSSLMG